MKEEDVVRFVERSRKEQGLPPRVEDPGVLAKVVALLAQRTQQPTVVSVKR